MGFLVLSRRPGERVIVRLPDGREIRIAVVEYRRDRQVRLALDAPDDVVIYREELRDEQGQPPAQGG